MIKNWSICFRQDGRCTSCCVMPVLLLLGRVDCIDLIFQCTHCSIFFPPSSSATFTIARHLHFMSILLIVLSVCVTSSFHVHYTQHVVCFSRLTSFSNSSPKRCTVHNCVNGHTLLFCFASFIILPLTWETSNDTVPAHHYFETNKTYFYSQILLILFSEMDLLFVSTDFYIFHLVM